MHSAVPDRHVWFLVFASMLCSHFFSTQFRDDPVPHDTMAAPPMTVALAAQLLDANAGAIRVSDIVFRETPAHVRTTIGGPPYMVPACMYLCGIVWAFAGSDPHQLGVGSGLARVGSGVCMRTHNVHTADTRQGCLSVVAVPGIPWHLHGIAPRRLGIACQSTLHYRALALAGTSAAQPSASCTTPDPSHSCSVGDWTGVSFRNNPTGGFATSRTFDSACAEHTAPSVVVVAQQCCSDSAYTAGEGTC